MVGIVRNWSSGVLLFPIPTEPTTTDKHGNRPISRSTDQYWSKSHGEYITLHAIKHRGKFSELHNSKRNEPTWRTESIRSLRTIRIHAAATGRQSSGNKQRGYLRSVELASMAGILNRTECRSPG